MNIGAIVLAAGRSKRFGGDKRKAGLSSGKWVLQQTIESISPYFPNILVVLREFDQDIADELLARVPGASPSLYFSPQSDKGMGHNLANAIKQVSTWDGVFIFLGDMPYIKPNTINQLIDELRLDNCVIPIFDGQKGHPAGFGANFFSEISALTGDQGAKSILQANQSSITEVQVEDDGVLRDIDVAGDLV